MWYEAITTASINLLYGIIASTILALLISFVTDQYEILRNESSYLSDINKIEFLCQKAMERQDIDQLIQSIDQHQQQLPFANLKPYQKSLLHSRKAKSEIQRTITQIEENINNIRFHCQGVINAKQIYNDTLRRYVYSFMQMLNCERDSDKYKEHQKNVAELSRTLSILYDSKNQKIQNIMEPTIELKNEFVTLSKYLHYNIENLAK